LLASGGYPGGYKSGKIITGLEQAGALDGVTVFHAGTRLAEDNQVVTAGGRVLNVTGTGGNLQQALQRAYQAIDLISFDNMEFRTDIGWRALS
jgi:phosphoribosylamine--glycine ligase